MLKPTEADFHAAMTDAAEQVGTQIGQSVEQVLARNAAAGRLKSGMTVRHIIGACEQSFDDACNTIVAEVARFTECSDIPPAQLRVLLEQYLRRTLAIIKHAAAHFLERLNLGPSVDRAFAESVQALETKVERRLRQYDVGLWPSRRTEREAATVNTIHAGTIIGGVQQGTHGSTLNVTNDVNFSAISHAAEGLRDALSKCVDSPVVSELRADVETIRAQIAKQKPSRAILVEIGKSIRSVAEEVAGGVLTPQAVLAVAALSKALGL